MARYSGAEKAGAGIGLLIALGIAFIALDILTDGRLSGGGTDDSDG